MESLVSTLGLMAISLSRCKTGWIKAKISTVRTEAMAVWTSESPNMDKTTGGASFNFLARYVIGLEADRKAGSVRILVSLSMSRGE